MRLKNHKIVLLILSAFLALGLVLGGLMASNAELHHAFHHDSDAPQHQCLATFLAHNPLLAAAIAIFMVVNVAPTLLPLPSLLRLYTPPLAGLPASRGPPLVG